MPHSSRMTRRRFLTLSASLCSGLVSGPARAARQVWSGQAFGADVCVELWSDPSQSEQDVDAIVHELREIEARFSIFLPSSELSQLNTRGRVAASEDMHDILRLARRVHRATEGYFDPTIQPLWEALAAGEDTCDARALIGFDRVEIATSHVRVAPGQKLSLNGIVQGYATDRITSLLMRRGYTRALVNLGEFRALDGPYRLEIEDPNAGRIGALSLTEGAIATSSPSAMFVGGETHILNPLTSRSPSKPLWSTVTVEAGSAALADAASTAFCLMDRAQIDRARQRLAVSRVVLIDEVGDLTTL